MKTPLQFTPLSFASCIFSSAMTLSFGLTQNFSINELVTTLTLEDAMAAPANIGGMYSPKGRKKPMARGMLRRL